MIYKMTEEEIRHRAHDAAYADARQNAASYHVSVDSHDIGAVARASYAKLFPVYVAAIRAANEAVEAYVESVGETLATWPEGKGFDPRKEILQRLAQDDAARLAKLIDVEVAHGPLLLAWSARKAPYAGISPTRPVGIVCPVELGE